MYNIDLLFFLYDTLMMAEEATETCRLIVIHDKTYFIYLHWFVCYILYIKIKIIHPEMDAACFSEISEDVHYMVQRPRG